MKALFILLYKAFRNVLRGFKPEFRENVPYISEVVYIKYKLKLDYGMQI
jgi:hypothetical protein